jgi:hypothetical protein
MVRDNISKLNRVVRDVPREKMEEVPWQWDVEQLPRPGPKAKTNTVIRRSDLGMRNTAKSHHLTIEIPYSAECSSNGDLQKQALTASRRDSLDILQSQSLAEQALGAATNLLYMWTKIRDSDENS